MTAPLAVVGLVEIADLLNVERTTVRTWYHRGKLPVPDALLAATPVWRTSTITKWQTSMPVGQRVAMTVSPEWR